ncbi:MAG: type II toxin-antitoxin system RelE/ParE family toxin [Alphaproteobacteria bacterium]|nr:MAG: type II toxin-antitoxin system RelE/ParE family toxin [Alphaproteobacteria bacterium]TAF41716.1 MAG: type II toxin-antitoxin system RelE/ParE family toxin [Alphaproteobacteria bacterium]TAF75657.1 MAG: type II toxin-antitoxin system RelE/ParE family toxin [Alphaproteobacteria bacterium]
MTHYRISKKAEQDLQNIWLYGVKYYDEQQADNYFFELIDKCSLVAKEPLHYQSVEHIRAGYRRTICGMHSIYYRICSDDGVVEIMAIIKNQDIQRYS